MLKDMLLFRDHPNQCIGLFETATAIKCPLLKLACSSRRVRSTASCSLFSSTLLNTLPGVESSVIPRQLLQSLRLPFFGKKTETEIKNNEK